MWHFMTRQMFEFEFENSLHQVHPHRPSVFGSGPNDFFRHNFTKARSSDLPWPAVQERCQVGNTLTRDKKDRAKSDNEYTKEKIENFIKIR